MRYLRMLSNSAFAGLLASVYLTWLLLHLNPSLPLTTPVVTSLLTVTLLSYGLHIFVVSYGLYVVRQIALTEPSTPGWISLRLLTWSAAALSGAAAAITWLHATGLRTTLDPGALPGLTRAAGLFAGATALFLLLAFAQLATQRRGRATVAILFTLATISSIAAPLLVRERPTGDGASESTAPGERGALLYAALADESRRILMLCLDGASLDMISPAVAAGRLPNFGRLLDRGASMHLATTRPTQPEPAWASVMTGKWPAAHGVRGTARYRPFSGNATLEVLPDYLFFEALVRFGLLVAEPHTADSLRARPLWSLLTANGVSSGVIGLPLTHPAEPEAAFMVSDHFHRRTGREIQAGVTQDIFPASLEETAAEALTGDDDAQPPALRARLDLMPRTAESASLIAADRIHHRLASRLMASDARVIAVRYPGLDAVGHYYLRYARPDAFAVTEDERRSYGRVLDDYYAYVDSLVGHALAALREADVLIVVSAFGMEPLPMEKRLLERVVGDERFTGTHERAPDGFLMAFGAPIAAGRLPRAAVVDVVPTLLYLLGLPVARDMDGSPVTPVFTRAFNAQRTITFIPTYE